MMKVYARRQLHTATVHLHTENGQDTQELNLQKAFGEREHYMWRKK